MVDPEQTRIESLLARIHDGDRAAREELFALLGDEERFGSALVAMARRLLPRGHRARRLADSGDIVQSALRSGLRRVEEFRGETEGELYAWLRSILRTKAVRVLRRRDAREAPANVEAIDPGDPASCERVPLSEVFDRDTREAVRRAVRHLPDGQRIVVELRLRGLDTDSISRLLDLPPPAVRKRESRAVQRLREALGG